MNWLSRLLTNRADTASLDRALREALAHWQALPKPDAALPHFETRYVVINTEASGLDLDHDRLLAVGAVAIDGGLLSPRESYYAKLEADAATALTNLLTFTAAGPAVVYNAGFNRTLLERALATHLGVEPEWIWLDLFCLMPALYGELIAGPARLADWLIAFGIETFQRRHALGDAWAIAQLMLAAQSRALSLGLNSARSLVELERTDRELRARG
jgi:DNA polymerase-3 subunit epsilon